MSERGKWTAFCEKEKSTAPYRVDHMPPQKNMQSNRRKSRKIHFVKVVMPSLSNSDPRGVFI